MQQTFRGVNNVLTCRWHLKQAEVIRGCDSGAYSLSCFGNVTAVLILIKVSDVNDDVRRAAVESIGFILFR